MAVDVCSDNFVGMNMINSPRFSFSKDLEENETKNPINNGYLPCRLDHSLDSAFYFAFNVDTTIQFQSSTADELFSDGKILPKSVRKDEVKEVIQRKKLPAPCLDYPKRMEEAEPTKKSLKEFLEDGSDEEDSNVAVTKPFWKFRRSNSVNSDNRNQKKGLIGSRKILSRSGSTGKFLEKILEEEEEEKPNYKNPRLFWEFTRSKSLSSDQNVHHGNVVIVKKGVLRRSNSTTDHYASRPESKPFSRSNSLSSSVHHGNVAAKKGANPSSNALRRSNSTTDHYVSEPESKPFRRSNSTGSAPVHVKNRKQQQHLLNNQTGKKHSFGSYYNSNNNNVKISPALNLPSPYISRISVDLFGIGSLFCNGSTKDRKKKKSNGFV